MSWWRQLASDGDRLETQLDAELRDHVERQVADYVATGYQRRRRDAARIIEFGGLEQVKELCRDARGTRWFEECSARQRDTALRVLRRNPSFTVCRRFSPLRSASGRAPAIFTLVDATMLKPLPVKEP